ncbi:hypothetical protein [Rhodopseudomonas palustris]|uniref:hypothetical protein n=1 Tax=Rhodopseudomonas palustris TaxID=1076 RepID=UPI000E6D1D72|nr:hypothetical protein [Rhodopseudomonas palustris]
MLQSVLANSDQASQSGAAVRGPEKKAGKAIDGLAPLPRCLSEWPLGAEKDKRRAAAATMLPNLLEQRGPIGLLNGPGRKSGFASGEAVYNPRELTLMAQHYGRTPRSLVPLFMCRPGLQLCSSGAAGRPSGSF